jgi:hypothetical protein
VKRDRKRKAVAKETKGAKQKDRDKKRGRLKFKRGNEMGNGSMEE